VYMIPERYRQVMAAWQLTVPPTVKVVRVDPKVPVVDTRQPQATPQPQAMPWGDEQ